MAIAGASTARFIVVRVQGQEPHGRDGLSGRPAGKAGNYMTNFSGFTAMKGVLERVKICR